MTINYDTNRLKETGFTEELQFATPVWDHRTPSEEEQDVAEAATLWSLSL